jgi:hypothetical protein
VTRRDQAFAREAALVLEEADDAGGPGGGELPIRGEVFASVADDGGAVGVAGDLNDAGAEAAQGVGDAAKDLAAAVVELGLADGEEDVLAELDAELAAIVADEDLAAVDLALELGLQSILGRADLGELGLGLFVSGAEGGGAQAGGVELSSEAGVAFLGVAEARCEGVGALAVLSGALVEALAVGLGALEAGAEGIAVGEEGSVLEEDEAEGAEGGDEEGQDDEVGAWAAPRGGRCGVLVAVVDLDEVVLLELHSGRMRRGEGGVVGKIPSSRSTSTWT